MLRAASEHPRPVPPNRQHRHRRPRTAKGLPAILLVIALLLAPVEFSLGQALTAPGQATVSVRLVEWLRDHGAGPVVDIVESWWYAHNRPTGTAPDPASLPRVALSTMEATAGVHPGPLPATGSSRLPGEAVWVPSTQCVGVSPPLYTAFFRPQPDAPSVIAGVAWMNQSVLRARLVAGNRGRRSPRGHRRSPGPGTAAREPAGHVQLRFQAQARAWRLLRRGARGAPTARRCRIPRDRHRRARAHWAVGPRPDPHPRHHCRPPEPRAHRRRRRRGPRARHQQQRRLGHCPQPAPVHLAVRTRARRRGQPRLRRGRPALPHRPRSAS